MKYILTPLIIFLSLNSNATHIAAGEMYYDYLGNSNYAVHVLLYRDCTGADLDDELSFTVFNQANLVVQQVVIPLDQVATQFVDYSSLSNASCLVQFPTACLEYYTYSTVVNLPPINGGYFLAYQRCCLTPLIVNVDTPDEWGYTFTCKIPGLETGQYENSSPRFSGHSLFLGCTNELINFNHQATDPDGDSLVYSLVTPKTFNLGMGDYDPNPETLPPYSSLPYESNFSAQDPIGSNAILTIDPSTGLMTVLPVFTGHFAIGVKVDEYKSDTLINSTYRNLDMQVGVGSLGIEDNISIKQFLLSPNPALNEVVINSKVEHSLIIITSEGKEVHKEYLKSKGTYIIDMTSFDTGVYYFQFNSKFGEVIKPVYK